MIRMYTPLTYIVALTMLTSCAEREQAQDGTAGNTADTAIAPATASAGQNLTDLEKKGKIAFLKCRSCHLLNEGDPHLTGPSLYGFYDAPAGTRADYIYSDALKSSGITWNAEALDGWLEKPSNSIPGTKMVYAGMPNKSEREALIAYLKTATQ
ncbi:MAG: c-type cytochrome [Parasphingorhabdus sp.]|uniref:c-type cytochrome n=1 Tax=Parasphingorhabdus sp. TaxID=2709688 RepID=UPI00329943B9